MVAFIPKRITRHCRRLGLAYRANPSTPAPETPSIEGDFDVVERVEQWIQECAEHDVQVHYFVDGRPVVSGGDTLGTITYNLRTTGEAWICLTA